MSMIVKMTLQEALDLREEANRELWLAQARKLTEWEISCRKRLSSIEKIIARIRIQRPDKEGS